MSVPEMTFKDAEVDVETFYKTSNFIHPHSIFKLKDGLRLHYVSLRAKC